jgi:hypothetical protein
MEGKNVEIMKQKIKKFFLVWLIVALAMTVFFVVNNKINTDRDTKFATEQMQVDSGINTMNERRNNNATIPVIFLGSGFLATTIIYFKKEKEDDEDI